LERRFGDMKLRPLNDRVLVLRIDEEEKTSGGIIIPDTAKEKPQEGKIVAVGPKTENEFHWRLRRTIASSSVSTQEQR
jgi:co-chaperonin GroES (HSP10)